MKPSNWTQHCPYLQHQGTEEQVMIHLPSTTRSLKALQSHWWLIFWFCAAGFIQTHCTCLWSCDPFKPSPYAGFATHSQDWQWILMLTEQSHKGKQNPLLNVAGNGRMYLLSCQDSGFFGYSWSHRISKHIVDSLLFPLRPRLMFLNDLLAQFYISYTVSKFGIVTAP